MILGLGGSDTTFRSKVYNILQLNSKSVEDYHLYTTIVNEVCYQVVESMVKDFQQFLVLLNGLPHFDTLPAIPVDPYHQTAFLRCCEENSART